MNEAEQLVYRASALMKKLEKKDRAELNDAVKRTQKSMKSKNNAQIVAACKELASILETMEHKIPHAQDVDREDKNGNNIGK